MLRSRGGHQTFFLFNFLKKIKKEPKIKNLSTSSKKSPKVKKRLIFSFFSSEIAELKKLTIFAAEFKKCPMNLTTEQKDLIEKMGVFHEKNGIPPTEARIIALLLVSDEIELTFDQIRETLQISKSATSNALAILLLTNRIEYITKPGDRKRYFRSNLSNWQKSAEMGLYGLLSINEILKEILAIRNPDTTKFNSDLKEVIGFIDFLQKELNNIFLKWQSNNKKNLD